MPKTGSARQTSLSQFFKPTDSVARVMRIRSPSTSPSLSPTLTSPVTVSGSLRQVKNKPTALPKTKGVKYSEVGPSVNQPEDDFNHDIDFMDDNDREMELFQCGVPAYTEEPMICSASTGVIPSSPSSVSSIDSHDSFVTANQDFVSSPSATDMGSSFVTGQNSDSDSSSDFDINDLVYNYSSATISIIQRLKN